MYKLKTYSLHLLLLNLLTINCNIQQDNSEFTLDLLSQTMRTADQSTNIIVSPLSIQTCLALAFIGADGKTADELSKILRLNSLDKNQALANFNQFLSRSNIDSPVKIANKIYAQNGIEIKSQFNKIATEKLSSQAENIDFSKQEEAAKIINDWADEKTNNKIQKLIDSSALGNARVILMNVIHFKGKWKYAFYTRATRKMKFWNDENSSMDVEMMHVSEGFKYAYLNNLDAVALQLPYSDYDLYMLLIIPNKKTGLKDLENNLQRIDLSKIENSMQNNDISLNLPKFRIDFSIQLDDTLKEMGVKTMFTDNADFVYLTSEKVKVDEVIHKAVIEVDELGTEAAGATYLKAVPVSLNMNMKYVNVNRPFIYFIKDSKVTYFMGRVSKF